MVMMLLSGGDDADDADDGDNDDGGDENGKTKLNTSGQHDNVCGGDNRDDHGDSKDDHNVGGNGDDINKDHLQHTITRTTAMRITMT